MISRSQIEAAARDLAEVKSVRENFRTHLLTALSEARASTFGMEPDIREKLIDNLTEYFNPDGVVTDLFTDAFSDAEIAAQYRVDELADESCLQAAE